MFQFASPYYFLLLVLVPANWYYRHRHRMHPVMGMSAAAPFKGMKGSGALVLRRLLPVLKYGALILMITALARPQWGVQKKDVLTGGINIVLAVDLSESMAALDFKKDGKIVNRLEAVKGVVQNFVTRRSGDRIGMVVFGSQAYTQVPLTRDYATIVSILQGLEIGAAGKSTAIGDAIGIALKRMADIESKSNVIILLTDGRSNSGEFAPDTAADIALEKNVKIYTIGVGSRGKVPFPVNDALLGQRYVYQRVDIDEDALKKIADKTGGLYFRAENVEGLAQIYTTIDQLEKTEVKIRTFARFNELYVWCLVPAFVLLALWILLVNTRFLEIP